LYGLSEQGEEGKNLYQAANCQRCHNIDAAFDPKKRPLKTKFELNGWVKSCANYFSIDWFPEEEERVIEYLNEVYYKLPKRAQ
jgi:hypothetical protein